MSARAWNYRRENKRFRLEVKRGLRILRDNPDAMVPLYGGELVMISIPHYEELMRITGLWHVE